jgi:hypothetical protein
VVAGSNIRVTIAFVILVTFLAAVVIIVIRGKS